MNPLLSAMRPRPTSSQVEQPGPSDLVKTDRSFTAEVIPHECPTGGSGVL